MNSFSKKMFEIPPIPCFTHTITWEIKYFKQFPFQFMNNLSSPNIFIKFLDLTIWRLFINTSKDELICVLKRMDSSKTVDEVVVDYDVCLVGSNNKKYFCNSGQFAATIQEPSSRPFPIASLDSLQNDHLRDDALVIRGNLAFKVNQEKILRQAFNEHLSTLSLDISDLLNNGMYSDLILKSGETETKVHKCILSVRWPYALSPDSTIEINNMSSEILDAILKYVYLKSVLRSEVQQLQSDLLISARKCQLPDLECRLKKYPVECHVLSQLCQNTLFFDYDLFHIATWPDSYPTHVRIMPISDLSVNDLMVTFSLRKDSEGRRYLGISFQFSDFHKSRPVFVICKMVILSQTNEQLNPLEFIKTFQKDEKWNLPPYFTEERYPSKIAHGLKSLRCEVVMCDGIDQENVEYVSSRFVVSHSEYFLNNPVRLSNSLYALLMNSFYSDVDLMVRGKTLQLHKAIISARSPWFKNCLNNLSNASNLSKHCIIVLNRFDEHIVRKIIFYIYCGRIDIQKKEFLPELLSAAEFFQLPQLEQSYMEAMNRFL